MPAVKKVLDEMNFADIKKIATDFNIGRNAIQDAVKQACGVGIREHMLSKRMEQAKQMIEEGKEVKEIALTLKYAGFRPFNRAFKKYYGVLPTEWDKRVQTVTSTCKL